MIERCVVCDSASAIPKYDGIVQCQVCGHIYADVQLSHEEHFNIYDKNYFFGNEYTDYLADRDVIRKNFELRLKVLRRFLDSSRHKKLLEIGCAYGFFLDLVKDLFDQACGIDITEDGICYAREQLGLDVLQNDFIQCDLANSEFDVACMWDTIEHLYDPGCYLEKLSRHMNSGALLAITTGDIGSLNARVKKKTWRLIHPPTHLHYFSRKTLTRLLDRYDFEVLYNRYCGFYRRLDSIAYYILVVQHKRSSIYGTLKNLYANNANIYSNMYDIMYVIARKR